MRTLPVFITTLLLGLVYQSHAQVLTTGQPATVTKTDYALPGSPKSMTVADDGASSGYIIGKRVNPDKKKNKARSPGDAVVTPAGKAGTPARRSNTRAVRSKARRDSIR